MMLILIVQEMCAFLVSVVILTVLGRSVILEETFCFNSCEEGMERDLNIYDGPMLLKLTYGVLVTPSYTVDP